MGTECHHADGAHPGLKGLALTQALAVAENRCATTQERLTAPRRRVLELLLEADGPQKAYDLIAAIAAQYDEPHAGAGQALLAVYIQNSLRAGLIQEGTWEAFRDFVVATPFEQLEAF